MIASLMSAIPTPAVLAAVDALKTYREGLYGDSDPGVTRKIVLGAACVAGLWLCLYLWDRNQKRRRAELTTAANCLFGELSAAHGLKAAERHAIEELAKASGLAPAESVFTAPEVLRRKVEAEPNNPLWPRLSQKLFGDDA